MALKLKTGKTITDNCGNEYSNAYLVVDQCNGNKNDKNQFFVVEIYKDQQARIDKKQPIIQKNYNVSADEWETYFSPEAITNNNDQYARAYEYIKQLEENIGIEEEPEMVKVYRDWEDLV